MSISGFNAENFLQNLKTAGDKGVITADTQGNLTVGKRGSKRSGKAKKLVENIENVKKQFNEVINYLKESKEKTREEKRKAIKFLDKVLEKNIDHLWKKTHNKKNLTAHHELSELKKQLIERYNEEML